MKDERTPRTRGRSDRALYGLLGALVAGLAGLVWWSLPGDAAAPATIESPRRDAGGPTTPERARTAGARIPRSGRASLELAIVTARPEDVVRAAATPAEIGQRLDARHCGRACDAVRAFIADGAAFEVAVKKTEDLLLPPADTFDVIAPSLGPAERAGVLARPWSVVLRAKAATTPEQLPARAAFAAAAVLAERLDGVVYDEVARRIDRAHDAAARAITAPLGEPVFARRHVVVQLYRRDDGTARVVTLGMSRFGAPDVSMRGASMAAGPLLAEVLNAAASQLARGASDAPLTITLEDVARVVGRRPAELHASPGTARAVVLDAIAAERVEGDPDNEVVELVPRGAAAGTPEGWDDVLTSLFGAPASASVSEDDPELAAIAARAQRTLTDAIRRSQSGEGALFVKGPFVIPEDQRRDGGAPTELLWLEVASCDARACTGTLSNEPSHATNLALGKTTSVRRDDVADWLIQRRDGGIVGGESIEVLGKRAAAR